MPQTVYSNQNDAAQQQTLTQWRSAVPQFCLQGELRGEKQVPTRAAADTRTVADVHACMLMNLGHRETKPQPVNRRQDMYNTENSKKI